MRGFRGMTSSSPEPAPPMIPGSEVYGFVGLPPVNTSGTQITQQAEEDATGGG
jgi:hypothetical protein